MRDALVVMDACVLAPFSVCDVFLRLAEEPHLYLPCWSNEILKEVHRTQINKLGWSEQLADYWRTEVTASFPESLISDFEGLLAQCKNDETDRHVLAAAIKAQASVFVTFNLHDFPKSSTDPHGVSVYHPSDYLCLLFDRNPALVLSRIVDITQKRKITPIELLRKLRKVIPRFAEQVVADNGWSF